MCEGCLGLVVWEMWEVVKSGCRCARGGDEAANDFVCLCVCVKVADGFFVVFSIGFQERD